MPTFTIDEQNNITAHGNPEEAAAMATRPLPVGIDEPREDPGEPEVKASR